MNEWKKYTARLEAYRFNVGPTLNLLRLAENLNENKTDWLSKTK